MPVKETVIDLTKLIEPGMEIYNDGHYNDPAVEFQTWCTVESQGYRVSRLSLGTQTGTHIDAPAHFVAGAETIDALPVDYLMGRYCLLSLLESDAGKLEEQVSAAYDEEPILFLRCDSHSTRIIESTLKLLCSLPCKVWVLAGEITVEGQDEFFFNRRIADKGIFLVEDLDLEAARQVQPGGRIVIMPLRLSGLSGSPCRVVVQP